VNCPIARHPLRLGITSEAPFLQKTVIAFPVKDDVIEKFNANNLSRLLDLLRGVYVKRRRFETSRRMVMRHDDTRSAVCQRISKDFTRMYWTAVY
jgi:ribosome-interacting GTPase 1